MPRFPILALPLLILSAGNAFAHAHLKTAEPAVDSGVATAPTEVAINFTEGVEPKFSTIVVQDAKGQRVDKADPHTAPMDAKKLIVGVGALAAGVYTVTWHATAVDTHQTDGVFHFTVLGASAEAISVAHPWARATPPNAATAAAYVTLTATGPADRIVGASTPVAGAAEIHETTNDQGVMKMRPVAALALEPGKTVTFAPGGYHIMLTGLKQPLQAGTHFPLTLRFEHAAPVAVEVTVEAIGAGAPAMSHDAAGHGGMTMGGASK
jgi:copper(I)-binding protein